MKNKKTIIKKFPVTILSLILIFSIVSLTLFAGAAYTEGNPITRVSLGGIEVPVEKNDIKTSDNTPTLKASNSMFDANGSSCINGMAAYKDTTVEGMFDSPAKMFFENAAGIDTQGVGNASWNDILSRNVNELKELMNKYNAPGKKDSTQMNPLEAFKSLTFGKTYTNETIESNPVEEMVDFTLELVMSVASTNSPKYSDLIDVANNATSMSDLLTDPVQHAGFVTVIAATSKTNPTQVDETPIGDLLLKSVDNIAPKESGEPYTDVVDYMLYKIEKDCGAKATRDTNIGEYIGEIIKARGEFSPEQNPPHSVPTVFWMDGTIDPERTVDISIEWPDYDMLNDMIYVTFDNVPVTSPKIKITPDALTGESVVTLSGLFAKEGIHTLFINKIDQALFVYINVTDPSKTTKPDETDITKVPTTQKADKPETTTEKATVIDTQPNIPKTGGKGIVALSALTVCSAAAVYTVKRKKNCN